LSIEPAEPKWRESYRQIDSQVEALRLPSVQQRRVSQDAEWCEVVVSGETRRIRFHDYDEVFKIPGLYEELFYRQLECCSPFRVANLIEDLLADYGQAPSDLRLLDIGAGNGMVGEELRARGVETIVGVDIIPEAKEATYRDRPEVYNDYFVTDLTDVPEQDEEELRKHDFNCMTTVAALGFGDIPPAAFLKALDLIDTPGWVAFNIKEDFLHEEDNSGFSRLVRLLSRERIIQIQAYRRYQHRLSIAGEPLHYVGMVARKLCDVPDHLFGAEED
jgi:predicted TPR repeat methyltransferase